MINDRFGSTRSGIRATLSPAPDPVRICERRSDAREPKRRLENPSANASLGARHATSSACGARRVLCSGHGGNRDDWHFHGARTALPIYILQVPRRSRTWPERLCRRLALHRARRRELVAVKGEPLVGMLSVRHICIESRNNETALLRHTPKGKPQSSTVSHRDPRKRQRVG